MLHDTIDLWLAFIVVALATTLPRSSFFLAPKKYQPTQHAYALLKYAPIAALTAIITPEILSIDHSGPMIGPRTFAAIATILTICRTRNPWLPFIVGIATLVALQS